MPVSVVRFPAVPAKPFHFWQLIHPTPRRGFFLGSGRGTQHDHHLYFSADEPCRFWTLRTRKELTSFETMLRQAKSKSSLRMPRFVGYLGFEAGRLFDAAIDRLPKPSHPLKTPAAEFGDYASVIHVDQQERVTTLYMDDRVSAAQKIRLRKHVEGFLAHPLKNSSDKKSKNKINQIPSYRSFEKMVKKVKRHIQEGDIYQANLSLRFSGSFRGDPRDLYQALSRKNPSPYACLIKNNRQWIVSSSPELLMDVSGQRVSTRPIAGTRPRGEFVQDKRLRGQLLLSPKERAEHIMLVDLARNDLGHVCQPGSVRVSDRYQIETYSHVMHIVSQVEGMLRNNENAFSSLKALFPGGTITGCPKIRAIQIIEELERNSRGPFYGSAGFFSVNGDAVFNILIRTAFVQNKKVYVQAGAGIVADSQARREYREVLAKACALLEAIRS